MYKVLFGRQPLICGALIIHGGVLVTLLTWHPHAGNYKILVAIASLWGVCDSIWTVQINNCKSPWWKLEAPNILFMFKIMNFSLLFSYLQDETKRTHTYVWEFGYSYYGVLFRGREEAAYSNLGLWEGVGYIISFALSAHVRTRYKVYLLLCNLIVGVSGYFTVEYRQYRIANKIEKRSTCEEERQAELEKLTT